MVFFTRTSNKKRLMLRMQRWIPGFGLKTSAVYDVKSSHSITRRRYYTHMWCRGEDSTLQNCPAVRHYHFNFPEFTSLLSFCARRSFHSAAKKKKKKIGDKCLPSFFQKKKRTGIISVGHSQQPRSFGLFQKACRSSVWEQFRSDIFRGWRRAADGNEFGCLSLPAEEQLETVCERSFSWKPLNSPHHVFDANTTFLHNRIETLHHNVWDPTAGIRSLSQPQQH